jgi:type III pantothenate kinase
MTTWLALMIGNSRLHWAYFEGKNLKDCWDSPHTSNPSLNPLFPPKTPLYFASVVPSQTLIWQNYHPSKHLTLDHIPLNNLYSTLGIDRALAVLGGGEKYHYPCLVIDAGTALTFTGVNAEKHLVGGAILAGLSLQFKALSTHTAALPQVILPDDLPPPWTLNTTTAIESGIIYTILSGIEHFINDWKHEFSQSSLIITGGDASRILSYLKAYNTDLFNQLIQDNNLIFEGIKACLLFQ